MNQWPFNSLDLDDNSHAYTFLTLLSASHSQVPLLESLYVSFQRLLTLVHFSFFSARNCTTKDGNSRFCGIPEDSIRKHRLR